MFEGKINIFKTDVFIFKGVWFGFSNIFNKFYYYVFAVA